MSTHAELAAKKRTICERFNANQDLARLLFVNPILAFEDAGVVLTPELRDHITDRMRFPPKLVERIKRLEAEIQEDLRALGVDAELPLSETQREYLFREVLKLGQDPSGAPRVNFRGREVRTAHPVLAKLADYDRARKGALIFRGRETYDAYKTGRKQHRWLKSIRFRI